MYLGFDDRKAVADFLNELDMYARAPGSSECYLLERFLPLALKASASRWWTQQSAFYSLSALLAAFCAEFLPAGNELRINRELERRTQHPEKRLVAYIRAMQALFNREAKAAPESESVLRIIRQSRPRFFHVYLHARTLATSEELVRAARFVQ